MKAFSCFQLLVLCTSLLVVTTPLSPVVSVVCRFYRKVLQVTENLFSQTSACRNRWEEADQLALSLTQLNLSVILHTMNTSLPTEQHQ